MATIDVQASATSLAALTHAQSALADATRLTTEARIQNDRAIAARQAMSLMLDRLTIQHRWSGTRLEIAGPEGWVTGPDLRGVGSPGAAGLSAYQIWLSAGNVGDVADYLQAMRGGPGDRGASVYEVWRAQGHVGSEADFLESLIGPAGASVYEVWLAAGNAGTVEQFIASLKGKDGRDGAAWHISIGGAPALATGRQGDMALELPSGRVHQRGASAWSYAGYSIIGPSGDGTGDVRGPDASIAGRLAIFDGSSGKLLADAGVAISELARVGHGHDVATTAADGFMAAADKAALGAMIDAVSTDIPAALAARVTVNDFAAALGGKMPRPAGAETEYIRGDGTLATFPVIPGTPAAVGAAPASHGHAIGDVADLAAILAGKQSSSAVLAGLAGLAPVADRMVYWTSTGPVLIPISAFARTLLDDADGATARATIGAEARSNRGVANGYASLDASAKIPEAQLPAIAITDVFTAASQAAMLALEAQRGDICVREDLGKTFVLATDSPGTLADWRELRTPTGAVLSVAGRTGAVVLAIADIAGLAAALAAIPTAPAHIGAQPAGRWTAVRVITDASYTIGAQDAGALLVMSRSSAQTLIAPAGALPEGAHLDVLKEGTGDVTISQGAGATVVSEDDRRVLKRRYGVATLAYYTTNIWLAVGRLE